MSDLISRQATLNQITAVDISIIPYAKAREYVNELKNYVIKIIETLPSAEPEQKTGKWIDTGWKIIYKCSECGNYLDLAGVNAGRGDANFCPSCGADMRGE